MDCSVLKNSLRPAWNSRFVSGASLDIQLADVAVAIPFHHTGTPPSPRESHGPASNEASQRDHRDRSERVVLPATRSVLRPHGPDAFTALTNEV
ncbi:hypothetical protein PD5205_02844 [Xanthomonas fragariae]|uniref:Uncharacterized protein n=1 Tax=Xanthomonas fragariae TaxID=48664 RepID=A0A1Y6HKV4_9XANT|nr:hypothetical protein NBC2815_02844 [Xanthomonas fragariae]SMQ98401.1 hypothetical protein PD885_01150 [Xanthomonas fragariae]SMR04134.1 hypothetical protein PD5205_02844 [Xanthomonas fragariae]